MEFKIFKDAVFQQFESMKGHELFRTEIDKDELWDTYINSFPPGSNPMFRERTEHDCSACKSFIRSVGNMVAIVDSKVISIWDISIGGDYQTVANMMSFTVRSRSISNIFYHTEPSAGVDKNFEEGEISIKTWEHFYIKLPTEFILRGDAVGTKLSEARSTKDVFKRSLEEIGVDTLETVLELIDQNSLYRGEENRFAVNEFLKVRRSIVGFSDEGLDIFCWSMLKGLPVSVTKIRGTAIGTLLVDLAECKELNQAVASFEAKVAPTNYKRPTALITKGMIEKAQQTVEELGFTPALNRRYAVTEDITINNILFANRETKAVMNVFDELVQSAPANIKSLEKVEEIGIETFIKDILPRAESLELLFENKHAGNLMSLIAPVDLMAPGMFKWHNNFSWAYTGELADSIKERVKNAGGNVEGDLRCSLSWFNRDDLDLHMIEPGGNHIHYGDKRSSLTHGNLDVDMNAGGRTSDTPVENICYPSRHLMTEGTYLLYVHNYSKRTNENVGFDVEIEFDGVIYSFAFPQMVRGGEKITVAKFKYTHQDGIEMIETLPSSQTSKEAWGLPTQTFHKVNMVMNSPNHWDDHTTGNKHYFFILDRCLNEGKARGFFNEFLTEELRDHRKVFEVLGSKMKAERSDQQLSGIGFSSTQRNHVFCKVAGSFTRTIKIIF